MSLINCNNLSLFFGDNAVLKQISFSVEKRDKIGLIGANGAGKTTLFKCLTKDISPDEGVISFDKEISVGYMEQHACADSTKSVMNELLTVFQHLFEIERELEEISKRISELRSDFVELLERQQYLNESYERLGGLTYKSRAASALVGIGFNEEDFNKPVSLLSGGQRSKLSLCKLLLCGADVLLLDEPTNHLDINSINWLEEWLSDYKGTFIVISHDRYFLDRITNKTWEIERGKLYSANKKYSEYLQIKEEIIKTQRREYEASMREVHRIEGIIEQQKRFNQAHNYVTIASKQKSIDRILDKVEEPDKELSTIKFSFKTTLESGNDVLTLLNISKSFDDKVLFKDVNFELKKGQRCFILGANGCGKSTLLKIILNKMRRDTGRIVMGVGLKIGYFDQTLAELSSDKMVIDEIWDTYKSMTETEVRSALAMFLFKGDDVFKIMNKLSGGEKARVALLKLMLSGSNFLVLDEPTNHLDIGSKEALEEAFDTFDGTMLVVSHDRYFINKLATRIVHLDTNGITAVDGNYDDYLRYTEGLKTKIIEPKKAPAENEYQRQKRLQSEKRKLQTRLTRLESEIDELESKMQTIQNELSSGGTDYERLTELTHALSEIESLLTEKMTEWEEVTILIEEY